jgi:hypothetical protein
LHERDYVRRPDLPVIPREEMLVRAGYAYPTATDWHRQHPALPS